MEFLAAYYYPVLLFVFGGLLVGSFFLFSHTGSPIVAIFSRWLRWIFIALLASGLLSGFVLPYYPFWVLFLVTFLGWFLIESAYLWLVISGLSRSDVELFPNFAESDKKEEWPSQDRFIRLKDTLREHGFKRQQALYASVHEGMVIRMVVFADAAQTTRVSVLFVPQGRQHISESLSISTQLKDGRTLITDNVFLPFGGFYPEEWLVERSPWRRNFESLLQRHRERMDAANVPPKPFLLSPLAQSNEDQRLVERINRKLHFLNQTSEEEEHGRLTSAGKVRVWQEIWLLAYFGRSLRYC